MHEQRSIEDQEMPGMHSHGCRNDDAADITAITEQSSFRVSDLLRPSDAYRAGGQSGASQIASRVLERCGCSDRSD